MSEQMDHAIIKMHFEMAMFDEISRRQFYARAQGILSERDQLRAEVESLRNLLRHAQPIIKSHAGASHMIEGFRPKRNQWDELVEAIDAAIQEENK